MKKIFWFIFFIFLFCHFWYWYEWLQILDNSVFEIPLDKYEIKVRVWNPVSHIWNEIEKVWWVGWINWSFFCPKEDAYNRCWWDNSTSSERISNGINYSKYPKDTWVRWVFGFTKSGEAILVQNNLWYIKWYNMNTNSGRYDEIYHWIWNFPILIDQDRNPLEFYTDHIDYKKNLQKATRNFICANKSWDRVYMWFVSNKTIYEMPDYLSDRFDCYIALNLDAWKSSAMFYNNKYIIWPWRKVTDWYIIVPKPERLDHQLKTYKLNKKEQKETIKLYNKFKKQILIWWEKKKKQILKNLNIFESNISIMSNVPERVKYRIIINSIKKL